MTARTLSGAADDAPETHTCAATCPDPEEVQYAYDGNDGWAVAYAKRRLTRVIEGSGQRDVVAYDQRGRVTQTRHEITVGGAAGQAVFSQTYDKNDRTKTVTYPDGEQVLTEYDDSGQPQTVRSGTQFYVINVDYDVFGRAVERKHGNAVVDTWTYGNAAQGHRLVALKAQLVPTPAYVDLTYNTYDARGLLTQLRDQRTILGERSNSADFAYDHMGRLTSFDSVHAPADRLYGYDALGNIKRAGDQFFTYDALKPHQITQVHSGSETGPWTGVTHDANGNREGKAGHEYTYTRDDRVASITAGGQTVEFVYDADGQRTARQVGSAPGTVTRYYSPLAETTGAQLTKWYFLGGQRIAMRQTMNTAWELAAVGEGSLRFAAVSAERPAVVLLVTREAGRVAALAVVGLAAGLCFAPTPRRRRVVGVALRRGQVIVVALLWGVGPLPWPLLVQPAEAAAPDVLRHYHLDHLGSTQAITDEMGGLKEQIRYSAYGEVRGTWDGNNQSTMTGAPTRYGVGGGKRGVTGVRSFALLIGATVVALSGCSPVYTFHLPSNVRSEVDWARVQARLGALLDTRGFRAIGFSDQATGDIGCGRSAPDRTTFEKGWRDRGFLATHHWVWVHEFSCEGAWYVVIVSSTNSEREAADLRDALSAEFASEIASGTLHVQTGCRLALE